MDMEKARKIAVLKVLKEHYEETAKRIGGEINQIGAQLYEELTEDETESIRISSSYKGEALFKDGRDRIIKPKLTYRPSVKDQESLFLWLRQNNCGEIIKEVIHPKTLESFVTKCKANNQPLPPQESLTVFDQKSVEVRLAPQEKGS